MYRLEYALCPNRESKEAQVNRIKRRMALLLAATALSTIFVAAPAAAADTCHPYPQAYCAVREFYYRCVVGPVVYGWPHCIYQ